MLILQLLRRACGMFILYYLSYISHLLYLYIAQLNGSSENQSKLVCYKCNLYFNARGNITLSRIPRTRLVLFGYNFRHQKHSICHLFLPSIRLIKIAPSYLGFGLIGECYGEIYQVTSYASARSHLVLRWFLRIGTAGLHPRN